MLAVEPLPQASAKLASSAPPGPGLFLFLHLCVRARLFIRSARALPSRTSNRLGCLEDGHSIPRGLPLSLDPTACEQFWPRRLPRLLASHLGKTGDYACSTFSASVIAPSPALPNYLPRRSLKIRVIYGRPRESRPCSVLDCRSGSPGGTGLAKEQHAAV